MVTPVTYVTYISPLNFIPSTTVILTQPRSTVYVQGSSSGGLIGGIVAGIVVLVIILLVIACVCRNQGESVSETEIVT